MSYYRLKCTLCRQDFGQVEISQAQIDAQELGIVSADEAFPHLDRNEIILFNTNLCERCFDMDDDTPAPTIFPECPKPFKHHNSKLFPLDEVAPVFQPDE